MRWQDVEPTTVYRVIINHEDFERLKTNKLPLSLFDCEVIETCGGPAHWPYITVEGENKDNVKKASAKIVNTLGKYFQSID